MRMQCVVVCVALLLALTLSMPVVASQESGTRFGSLIATHNLATGAGSIEEEIRTLVAQPSEGVMGVFDYPVWGPVSLGFLGSVWHQTGTVSESPYGVDPQNRLHALLVGGPSVRLTFDVPSEWSLFAAAHGGLYVSYREPRMQGLGSPERIIDPSNWDWHNGLGFTLGLSLPTLHWGGMSISAAALYEQTRFPGMDGPALGALAWSDAFAVQRLAFGIDISFSF